jgi:hypothetical protein
MLRRQQMRNNKTNIAHLIRECVVLPLFQRPPADIYNIGCTCLSRLCITPIPSCTGDTSQEVSPLFIEVRFSDLAI